MIGDDVRGRLPGESRSEGTRSDNGADSSHRVLELERTLEEHRRELDAAREREQLALAEAALQRTRLAELLRNIPAAISVVRGPELVFEFVNDQARKLLLAKGSLEGRTVSEAVPELEAHIRKLVEEVMASGERHRAPELKVRLEWEADGHLYDRYFDVLYEPLKNVRGEVDGLLSLSYDVTQLVEARTRAEELSQTLQRSDARARRLQESGIIGVVLWTREGALIDANDAFLSMLGYTREELEAGAMRWVDITPAEYAPLDQQAFAEMDERGFCTPYEKEYVAKDGQRIPIQLGVAFWEGRRDGGVAWILDIRQRKQAELARETALAGERAYRRKAEDASRAKDEFLSTLSHELRTPLNAILGWANLLRDGRLPEARASQAIETIERNARAQARLIEDMLESARIEQGKLVLSVGPVEMVRVVELAIDSIRPAAEAKNIRLQPVLDSHATIIGDADRLQQVIWNLLSNAIKFTPKGGRVQVLLRRERSYVEVLVVDNGQGIELDFLPQVFDRFRQADGSASRKAGGLGLGLAIVRSLVALHGGTVSAHSEGLGHGAMFVLRLPTAPIRADRAPPERPDDVDPPPVTFDCPAGLAGKRVLLLDDEVDTRALLSFLLESCECTVMAASTADEARALLQSGSFDVLLSDVGMPGEDGYAFIQSVRKLPARGARGAHSRARAHRLRAARGSHARPEVRLHSAPGQAHSRTGVSRGRRPPGGFS